jgi:hypothetical protein
MSKKQKSYETTTATEAKPARPTIWGVLASRAGTMGELDFSGMPNVTDPDKTDPGMMVVLRDLSFDPGDISQLRKFEAAVARSAGGSEDNQSWVQELIVTDEIDGASVERRALGVFIPGIAGVNEFFASINDYGEQCDSKDKPMPGQVRELALGLREELQADAAPKFSDDDIARIADALVVHSSTTRR